jgi:thiol-disulfide isomerase/thioredoxin
MVCLGAGTLYVYPTVKTPVLLSLFLVCFSSLLPGADPFRKAPELPFNLPQEGQKLLSSYRGKVVSLEFILTTCVHCQAASKVMTKLQEEYGPQGFQALDVAINGLDEGRTPAAADALVASFKSSFQVGFPVGWIRREQMSSFLGVSMMERMVVPQLVLIDRKGLIHYQTPPMGDANSMAEGTLRQRIQELLALVPVDSTTTTGSKASAKKR